MDAAFLQDLLKISPLVAVLGVIAWQFRGDSREDRKALIDVYAKALTEATLAIKDVTAAMQNSSKTDEMAAKNMAELTAKIDRLMSK